MKELQEAEDMQVSHWPYRVKAPDFLVSHWQSCVTTGFDTRPLLVKSHLTSQQLMLVKNGGFELFGRTSDQVGNRLDLTRAKPDTNPIIYILFTEIMA